MRVVRVGMLAALVALIAGVAPASAEVTSVGGFKYVTKSFAVPGQKTKRPKAVCPGDTHAYGGGQFNTTLYGQFAQLQSYPVDDGDPGKTPDDGWGVLVKNLTGSAINVVAYAVCGAPAAEYKQKHVPMTPDTYTGETDMRCKNKHLVGGGMFGPGRAVLLDGGADVFTEGPTYYTYLHNASQTKDATATQYAVCAGVDTSYIAGGGKQIGAGVQDQDNAACPNKTAVLSGGMYSTGGVTLNASFPPATFREWTIVGDNTQASERTIGVLAVCGAHP